MGTFILFGGCSNEAVMHILLKKKKPMAILREGVFVVLFLVVKIKVASVYILDRQIFSNVLGDQKKLIDKFTRILWYEF